MTMVEASHRKVVMAVGLACMLAVSAIAQAADATPAQASKFIEGLADKAIAALTSKDITSQERASRFRVLLREHFAVETIGRWVLGRHWRTASEVEQTEYLKLFEDLMTTMYADRFANYSGESLVMKQAQVVQDSDIIVATEIANPGNREPLKVDWRVRSRDGDFKIVDVIVEGISMGQTQRSDFASFISQNGGTVSGLNRELKKRLN